MQRVGLFFVDTNIVCLNHISDVSKIFNKFTVDIVRFQGNGKIVKKIAVIENDKKISNKNIIENLIIAVKRNNLFCLFNIL